MWRMSRLRKQLGQHAPVDGSVAHDDQSDPPEPSLQSCVLDCSGNAVVPSSRGVAPLCVHLPMHSVPCTGHMR
eukprot:CAMPEP_0205897994 /NCGR_PEP_ID=MMETSP1083-20121108/25789_1 /ASSEMBLY_ACC=CAM_ASM_000430 /TAXON_ID=97485 /ORGANISM="Prymnesium parvum, Strain Texoma1" /LENGTH=72 /DNA_ID=CAMNT_0053263181 /DNA_START=46 /DNA_END=261 /DNA_ORIENTATION=-